jgi:tetratricopeptide (TPR) repeat protein
MACLVRLLIVFVSLAIAAGQAYGDESKPEDVRIILSRRFEVINTAWRAGETKKFEAPAEELHIEQRSALGRDDADTLVTEKLLAQIKRDLGQFDTALALADHALAGLRIVKGEANGQSLHARIVRATVLYELARWREAGVEYEAVLVFAPATNPGRVRLLAQTELVLTYQKLGRLGEAAAIGEQALQEQAQPNPRFAGVFVVLLDNLAGTYLDLGRVDDAVAMQQRANAMYVATYGPDHDSTLTAQSNLASVLRSAGRLDESIAISRDVVRRLQAMPEAPPRNVARFFERVAEGTTPVNALAETKRDFLRDPRTADPLHWAAFVLYGR